MHTMKFGLFILPSDIAEAQQTARQAEAQGFYSISHNDHFYSPLGKPISPQLECFTVLTAIAAVTEKIKLAPAVAVASFRSPPLLAKIATSLDIASQGRFICGLGAGWQDKEYEAHGIAFPPLRTRLQQLDETVQILKAMWTEDEPAFTGQHFRVHHAYNNPRAIQQPHPPIMLGGSGSGLLEIAAREADIINMIPPTGNGKDFVNDPAATRKFDLATLKSRVEKLHALCRDHGRDPQAIEIGGLALLALSENSKDPALRDMADRLGFNDYKSAQESPVALLGTPDEVRQQIEQLHAETTMSYFIMLAANPESQALFSAELMPEFSV